MEKDIFKKQEILHDVNLRIQDPYMDKHFMIGFDGKTEKECEIYNRAIDDVMSEADLNPFHQVGEKNKPGYHAWEVWRKTDKNSLEKLLLKIEERVKELKKDLGIE